MKRVETLGRVLYSFDSFEEYLDRAANPVHKLKYWKYYSDWGTPQYQSYLDAARMGDPKMIGDIDKWRNLLVNNITGLLPRPEPTYDKVGAMWDIGRVIDEDPECWMTEMPSNQIDRARGNKIVRLVINTAASFGAFSTSHYARSGAILALTQLLEMLDFFVQFEVTTAIGVRGQRLEFRTIAKYPNQMLNTPCVAFWTSSDMERHIDFAICETLPECSGGKDSANYGGVHSTLDRGDICFDGMDSTIEWHNETAVTSYLKTILEAQGITLIKD